MPEAPTDLQDILPTQAGPGDASDIADLRTRLVDWMYERGIDQWHHGEVDRSWILEQTSRNEWWVVRAPNRDLAATARLVDEDPAIWGIPDRPAIYLHGLMVDRRYAGQQLGGRLLEWAAARGRSVGAEVLRLDCVASNTALCSYYLRQGFRRVGTKRFSGGWATTALFERPLSFVHR